tara:strand:- start:42 stop:383 length:342 start_codon:yes stop_codon:yes gene_type:complete
MPGDHSEEERERKKRVNKLKARTSKMRLAAINKRPWAKENVTYYNTVLKDEMKHQKGTGVSEYEIITDQARDHRFETPFTKDEKRYIGEQDKRDRKGLKRQPYYYPDGEKHER